MYCWSGRARAQEAQGAAPAAAPAPETPAVPAEASPPATSPATPAISPELERRLDELDQRTRIAERKLELAQEAAAQRAEALQLSPPFAGYSAKNFFLRSQNDWYVLILKGRLNVDYYHFLNRPDEPPANIVANSPSDPRQALKDLVFLRRARIGLAGTIAHHIDFRVEGEFASVPAVGQYATLTDASIVVNYTPLIEVEVGQFYAPFTLENPTSENYTDFMEKSAPVRFAVPTSREDGVMVFGELPWRTLRYWVGVFDGDGQNFKNLDDQAAVIGRSILAPLALVPGHPEWTEYIWIGGSGWWQKNENLGGPSAASTSGATAGDISGFTTQASYSLFNSNFSNGADAMGNAIRSHLAPNGTTSKYAFELNVPILDLIGVRAEYIHQSIDLREYNDLNPGNGNLTRSVGASGQLKGSGWYAELYGWIGGPVNVDRPGLYQPPHWRGFEQPPPPKLALMLAAKYEHVGFDVSGFPGTTSSTGKAAPDPSVGHYALDVVELGASLWMSRHSRIMANYLINHVGAGETASAAPMEIKNIFFHKNEQELLFRFAVAL
jgi:hypothetical protein